MRAAPNPFGFSLYGMKTLTVAEGIRACANIGYDGVELALMPGWPSEPSKLTAAARRDIRDQLRLHKQSVLGLMENFADATNARERLKMAAELAHSLAPDAPPPIETILGGKPTDWPMIREKFLEQLRSWAEIGRETKTVIAVKPHVSNALHQPTAAKALVEAVGSPWLRVAFDYSHFTLRNITIRDAATTLLPLTAFVHVKDAKGTAAKVEFVLPGEGDIDYRTLQTEFMKAQYLGPIVVEVSGMISNKAGYDPIAAAKKAFDNLKAVFKKDH